MDWVMCLERKHPELFDGNENYSKTPPEKVKKMMRQPGPFSRSSFQLFKMVLSSLYSPHLLVCMPEDLRISLSSWTV